MDEFYEIVKILKALSDENRVRILSLLNKRQNICVCEIREVIGLSQPTISSHLKVLENAGLVENLKDGKWINYKLNSNLGVKKSQILNQILSAINNSNQIVSDNKKLQKVDRFRIILKAS
ncbi:MAG: metalloregulator ArsR/SmtB family transcription factor [Actinobacteria bacterium]|nr:metalloregulator ArsR/SmtB family transcription factor [Actinomycetota bacterium]